ncbi:MAG TPA: glutamate racemase [bacterium]|nr:glutamate racemase [bacterium]HPN32296.1 glutamate racemase [bacterium]
MTYGNCDNPIGVFDSGLGGLTVVRELRRILPFENIIYFGDTARVPYGSKSKKKIIEFSIENVKFLLLHNVKIIVVACNTSTAAALDEIQKIANVPVVGVITPGVKYAVSKTFNKKVGVIGTLGTINSEAYTKHILDINGNIHIYSQPCPLFVPLVEEGWIDKHITELVISEYLSPLKIAGIDTLILGCTHYPLIKNKISDFFDNQINIVDSAESCSIAVKEKMEYEKLLNNKTDNRGIATFFVSDTPAKFSEIGSRFLGEEFTAIKVV